MTQLILPALLVLALSAPAIADVTVKAMAGMMAKMGNMSSTSTVMSVETGAVAADLFSLPAGYKIKEQQ